MDTTYADATQSLLDRILELHASGCAVEQVAVEILNADPETALFRVEMLIKMIINYARSSDQGENLMNATLSRAASRVELCRRASGGV